MNTPKPNPAPADNPAPAAAAAAAKPAPVFVSTKAQRVRAWRHDKTARTVAFHQAADDGRIDLFSVTGVHIATEAADAVPPPVETPKDGNKPATA